MIVAFQGKESEKRKQTNKQREREETHLRDQVVTKSARAESSVKRSLRSVSQAGSQTTNKRRKERRRRKRGTDARMTFDSLRSS